MRKRTDRPDIDQSELQIVHQSEKLLVQRKGLLDISRTFIVKGSNNVTDVFTGHEKKCKYEHLILFNVVFFTIKKVFSSVVLISSVSL